MNDAWILMQGHLVPQDVHEDDQFAFCVDISGNYIAVGAPFQSNGAERTGAVYVYKYNGNAWVLQTGKLIPADATYNDECGRSVAIDGDYIVVGTSGGVIFPDSLKNKTNNKDHSGKAYIYKNANGTWVEKHKIFDENSTIIKNGFGKSVSISGTRIAVGSNHGNAFVFDRISDDNWGQITVSPAQTGILQVSVSQNSLAIGNHKQLYNGAWNGGVAYIYDYENGAWVLNCNLVHSTEEHAYFGYSVCIDDNYIVVGAPGEETFDDEHAGAAYIYRRNMYGVWLLLEKVTPAFHPDVGYQNTNFGQTVYCAFGTIIIGRAGCVLPALDCNPSPPSDFPGAVTFLTNYIYPCDRIISEDDYYPTPGIYPENSAGYVTLGGNSTSEVYFQEGVDIAYLGNEILLLDGFTAAEGSDFTAKTMICSYLPTMANNLMSFNNYQVANFKEENPVLNTTDFDTHTNSIKVYPNPSTGNIIIEFSSVISNTPVFELVNIYGKSSKLEVITNDRAFSINLSPFPKGIYLLVIKTNQKVYTEKIILQ